LTEYTVHAQYDRDAAVWVAESADVPGLVTEAETLDSLVTKLRSLVPELLRENGVQEKQPTLHVVGDYRETLVAS
jgi:predicted RNase H-like HicB family nuclease